MTPKEKAEELFLKYAMYLRANLRYDEEANEDAIEAALIAVDEIIKSNELDYLITKDEIDSLEVTSDDLWLNKTFNKYWKEVKNEICDL
jgi:fibronectin type 3 domain-containing protein